MKEKLLKTPQGAESIFLDEAYKHEKINELINKKYTSWGYLPIKTPVFDFYETYEKLLSTESKKNCFRLMDRNGELLLLRNDITLFLARQLGRIIKDDNKPLRVHYADSIMRHQSEIDISNKEFFQTGAELVGQSGINGDLEVITLLNSIINELKLNETKIHIGSRSLLDGVLKNFPDLDSITLIGLINLRDIAAFSKYLNNTSAKSVSKDLIDLFLFIGTYNKYKIFCEMNSDFIDSIGIRSEIDYLALIGNNLAQISLIDNFRIDLSEVANRSYYTGIVFKAYCKDVDSPIASGGRYDKLISKFGKSIPSVGFSLLLRKVEPIIEDNRFIPPNIEYINITSNFVSGYNEAEAIRENGNCAVFKGDK